MVHKGKLLDDDATLYTPCDPAFLQALGPGSPPVGHVNSTRAPRRSKLTPSRDLVHCPRVQALIISVSTGTFQYATDATGQQPANCQAFFAEKNLEDLHHSGVAG